MASCLFLGLSVIHLYWYLQEKTTELFYQMHKMESFYLSSQVSNASPSFLGQGLLRENLLQCTMKAQQQYFLSILKVFIPNQTDSLPLLKVKLHRNGNNLDAVYVLASETNL